MTTPLKCPCCIRSLSGDPIPDEFRWLYGTQTHYSLVEAIRDKSGHVYLYRCPRCDYHWDKYDPQAA